MRGAPTRRAKRETITPSGLMLVVLGFLALTFIVLLPAQAGAAALDGAGTASLKSSPVDSAARSGSGQQVGSGQGSGTGAGSAGPDASSSAVSSGGGLAIPGFPKISRVLCLKQCVSSTKPTRGAIIALRGDNLGRVTRVFFAARKGRVAARLRTRSRGAVRVTVPKQAVRGFVGVIDSSGNRTRTTNELRIFPISAIPILVFPVRGPISFGSSGSRFGAGRTGHTHQGQDVSASCGTPLVSIRKARVIYNQWDGGGGNYVVLHNLGTSTNFVYMHMIRRSPLRVGQVIGAGTQVGRVGNTGDSSGCHLHFEYWIGPWQTGGHPIDPLAYLRSLLK
ncbi:MAG: M23 family metallopeptidase [Solirubrobacterales bacterium]|nr:M23 family metallopeptidase [Solirubrobacterales bacterium]MCB8915896.1 M23 family metallopeptidase [Thermoleophilales bacterium]